MLFKSVRLVVLLQHQNLYKNKFSKIFLRTFQYVPSESKWASKQSKKPRTILSENEIKRLEQLSLLEFKNIDYEKSILEDAIEFADELNVVNTENVEPMVTVLEENCQFLREDVVTEKTDKKEILRNAKVTMEDYYVAPLGNVNLLDEKKKEQKLKLSQ